MPNEERSMSGAIRKEEMKCWLLEEINLRSNESHGEAVLLGLWCVGELSWAEQCETLSFGYAVD